MKFARFAASIAVIAIAAVLIHRFAWVPLRCNYVLRQAVNATRVIEKLPEFRAVPAARENAMRTSVCIEYPFSVEAAMIAAANLRIAGQPSEALATYKRALRYDRRPEIYFAIGDTLVEIGKPDKATTYYLAAGYSGAYTNLIGSSTIRNEVEQTLLAREAAIRAGARTQDVRLP